MGIGPNHLGGHTIRSEAQAAANLPRRDLATARPNFGGYPPGNPALSCLVVQWVGWRTRGWPGAATGRSECLICCDATGTVRPLAGCRTTDLALRSWEILLQGCSRTNDHIIEVQSDNLCRSPNAVSSWARFPGSPNICRPVNSLTDDLRVVIGAP